MILEVLNCAIRKRGISYNELARRVGMPERVFWNRMHGRSKLGAGELLLIARELGISLDELSERCLGADDRMEDGDA